MGAEAGRGRVTPQASPAQPHPQLRGPLGDLRARDGGLVITLCTGDRPQYTLTQAATCSYRAPSPGVLTGPTKGAGLGLVSSHCGVSRG